MKIRKMMIYNVYYAKRGYFLFMAFFLIVNCVIETLGFAHITKEIMSLLLAGNGNKIGGLVIEMLCLIGIAVISGAVSSFFRFKIKRNASINIENAAIKHLFSLTNWQINYNQGDYFTKVRKDIPDLVVKYMDNVNTSINMFISILLGSLYACVLDWRVFLLCLILVLISFFVTSKSYKEMPAIERKAGDLYNKNYGNVWEYVSNSEIIPFLNFTKVTSNFDDVAGENVENAIKKGKSYANVNISQKIINVGLVLAVCIVGAFFSLSSINLTEYIARLTALVVLIPKVATSFMSCYDWNISRMEIKGICTRLKYFFELDEYSSSEKFGELNEEISDIKLINLFVYYDKKQVIRDLNYCFNESNLYCVVGKSGSGKSTLLKAICSLVPIADKMIYINKSDLTCISREKLWQKITYVSQQSKVFSGSIVKNIVLDKRFDEDKFNEACSISTLKGTINDLNRLNHDIIDETKLSSGEKQKICLARAIYLNKKILILDEALSAMDPVSQKAVIDNLYTYIVKNHMICIMVEHNEAIIPSNAIKLCLNGGTLVC